MKITNTERMRQITSSMKSLIFVISKAIEEQNPELLDSAPCRIRPNYTISNMLCDLVEMCTTAGGDGPDAKYYYADIEIGYTENSFPVEHR